MTTTQRRGRPIFTKKARKYRFEYLLLFLLGLTGNFSRNDVDCFLNLLKPLDYFGDLLLAVEVLPFNKTGEHLLKPSTNGTLVRCVVYFFHIRTE